MSVGINLVLIASALLFAAGAFALLSRRSAIVMLMGTQLMFAAGGLAIVAFARFGAGAQQANSGVILAIFAGITAVAELAIGAAIAVLVYQHSRDFYIDADNVP